MAIKSSCSSCDVCDLLTGLNQGLINVADARLYNIRYGLDRYVDYSKFRLLKFYKTVAEHLCEGSDCGCYTSGILQSSQSSCQSLGPLCEQRDCEPACISNGDTSNDNITTLPSTQNIIERIKILSIQ